MISSKRILFSLTALTLAPLALAQILVTRTFTPGLAVPDSSEVTDIQTFDVGGGNITNLQVGVTMSGVNEPMFNGDYYVQLGHDSASAVLLNRPGVSESNGFGYADNGLSVTFADDAPNGDVHNYRTTLGGGPSGGVLTGTWAPDGRLTDPTGADSTRTNLLAAFNGQAASGQWRLFVSDENAGGTARLDSWRLTMTVTPDGSTQLQLNNSQLSASTTQSFTNPVVVTGASTIASAADVTLQGALSGGGVLTKENSGKLTLQNVASFTGALAVTAGTIDLPSGLGGTGGDITVGASGTLSATGTVTRDVSHQGTIRGPALDSGAFLIFAGTVSGAGSYTGRIEMNGAFSPGNSPAIVTFNGDLALGSTDLLTMEIGGTTAGSAYDQLHVTNTLTFGGTLQVSLINGFTPSIGQTYQLFNAGSYASAFNTQQLATLPNTLQWDTSQLTSAGLLGVTASAIPEPSTWAWWSGAIALAAVVWRRRKTARS